MQAKKTLAIFSTPCMQNNLNQEEAASAKAQQHIKWMCVCVCVCIVHLNRCDEEDYEAQIDVGRWIKWSNEWVRLCADQMNSTVTMNELMFRIEAEFI